nr:unnamed protein product [Callosobruchus analis]
MHEGSAICPDTGKPEINIFYNKTKGGVDAFDQMCGSRSCSRKTRRWPLCILYGMLNMACINSWIIFNHNSQRMGEENDFQRKIYDPTSRAADKAMVGKAHKTSNFTALT